MRSRICLGLVGFLLVGFPAMLDVRAHGWRVDWKASPAYTACKQAISDGFYTAELYGQCVDDYNTAGRP